MPPMVRRMLAAALSCLALCACRSAAPEREYTLVLIKTGPMSGKLTAEESKTAFAGHFSNMERLAEERQLLVAGPFGEKRHDPELRGLFILDSSNRSEAESLATSTEWGPTAGRYRDLMRDWKAAGPAPRDVDEALWRRFRGAQDAFFGARDAANSALDAEFAANADVKEQILVEAGALVPVQDLEAAKRTFRDLAERWDAAGKVPRDRMKDLEGRMRRVEQALRGVEDEQWRRSDPEKSARANDVITKLESAIAEVEADLEQARAAGNQKKVAELESNLASRQMFLDAARRASEDFG